MPMDVLSSFLVEQGSMLVHLPPDIQAFASCTDLLPYLDQYNLPEYLAHPGMSHVSRMLFFQSSIEVTSSPTSTIPSPIAADLVGFHSGMQEFVIYAAEPWKMLATDDFRVAICIQIYVNTSLVYIHV